MKQPQAKKSIEKHVDSVPQRGSNQDVWTELKCCVLDCVIRAGTNF